ncbi:Ditrans,polycis-undecaprenyl-diphosphate synthase ((2E,6E)-farnesyl-diphosphate specific) (fragment) [anaerobic digester metagenome]|uniref:Ditrans,polycis-undecaprenyl-diphosphate synthase ((2E,6E)-farnesyl-diphosphate specific) n=1 Tax=anaerobic digester metagenome TaxID=1263854 RepID=A0A485M7U2_9ZZZZ
MVNYGWKWDLNHALRFTHTNSGSGLPRNLIEFIASSDISRVDLIVRWGGRRRLSGFLPVQSIYADFYVVDELWPNFEPDQFYQALRWYENQDITLGG